MNVLSVILAIEFLIAGTSSFSIYNVHMVLYKRLGSAREQFWNKFNKLKGNANRNSYLALLTVDAQAYRKNPLGDYLIKPYNQLNTKETMQNVQ